LGPSGHLILVCSDIWTGPHRDCITRAGRIPPQYQRFMWGPFEYLQKKDIWGGPIYSSRKSPPETGTIHDGVQVCLCVHEVFAGKRNTWKPHQGLFSIIKPFYSLGLYGVHNPGRSRNRQMLDLWVHMWK
jgi:hypothetical protein